MATSQKISPQRALPYGMASSSDHGDGDILTIYTKPAPPPPRQYENPGYG